MFTLIYTFVSFRSAFVLFGLYQIVFHIVLYFIILYCTVLMSNVKKYAAGSTPTHTNLKPQKPTLCSPSPQISAMIPDYVASAPGKALLAGGYLVLFPEFSGLSVALDSRVYAAAKRGQQPLVVECPQFASEWKLPEDTRNPYLAAAYNVVSSYYGEPLTGKVTIWSDDGFHSQAGVTDPRLLKRFANHGKDITQVPKTGLGSSAAFVVAVVRGLVALRTDEVSLQTVHNLAQIAHCIAQGKIGSGFDVATAVYGTILYTRFPAATIDACMPDAGGQLQTELVRKCVDSAWDMSFSKQSLPDSVQLVLGDVAVGTKTTGMVKKVLSWKQNNPEASAALFSDLNAANQGLVRALDANTDIKQALSAVRAQLQRLTRESQVDVEPLSQSKRLDAASEISGVLGAVVPGAGGDDAVCLLVDSNVASVEAVLAELNKRVSDVSWMQLDADSTGLKSEPVQEFDW